MLLPISQYIHEMEAMGIFDFYLPFFLFFAIIYALLTKSEIFGKPTEAFARKINIIVALAASSYIMLYSPLAGVALTWGKYLSSLFGQTFVIISTFLAVAVIGYMLKPFGLEPKISPGSGVAKLIMAFLVILGIGLFIQSGGFYYFFSGWPQEVPGIYISGFSVSPSDLAIIFLIIVTGLVVYFLYRSGEAPAERGGGGGLPSIPAGPAS